MIVAFDTSDWSEILESFTCLLVSIRQEATNMAHENKVALVTGSNRGIGFETARQLGKHGATVVVSARTELEAAQAARKLHEEGIKERSGQDCQPRQHPWLPDASIRG
jgi:NAD(P)-dependent dehydrogenase (short-subunit alcohol dehydrogenase family)